MLYIVEQIKVIHLKQYMKSGMRYPILSPNHIFLEEYQREKTLTSMNMQNQTETF